jgi:SAM-dependent methyltransferase
MSEKKLPSLEGISTMMEGLLEREGETPSGVGYPKGDQETRFAPLVQVIEPGIEGFTMNDLGCGFADLYRFIHDSGLPIGGYRGYDLSERMLEIAKTRVADDAELIHSNRIDRRADYSFACGVFNSKLEASDEEWLEYMKTVVRNLAEHSDRGFAFNSLTSYVDYREPHLFYVDPMEMFEFCKREISPRVSLLHDYPLWEWTMIVRTGPIEDDG